MAIPLAAFGAYLMYLSFTKTMNDIVFMLSLLFFVPSFTLLFMWYDFKRDYSQAKTKLLEAQKHEKELLEEVRHACGGDVSKMLMQFKESCHEDAYLGFLKPTLNEIILALSEGNFEKATSNIRLARMELKDLSILASRIWHERQILEEIIGQEVVVLASSRFINLDKVLDSLDFAARACDALYLGDVEKMRELLNEARKMLDERDELFFASRNSNGWFFKYLFEFHYFLLKAVVEAYETEMGAVARATQKQAERFAAAKPVEVPQTVEKVTLSAEEPERELYRGEVRFKMGAMSQERVGTLVITNKRLRLHGKYRLKGMVATVAVKAALRAAGVGEIDEDISLKEISWLELKKGILGGHYLEFKSKGKKYTIYTDAAQHIYNILRQYQ